MKKMFVGFFKKQFYFLESFIQDLLFCTPKIKFALPLSLASINLDSNNERFDEYVTVAQLAQRYPAFSQGSIRWMIANNTKGFHKVIRRIGRKVVINLSAFRAFLEEQTQ